MATIQLPGGPPMAVPRRKCEAESEPVSLYKAGLRKDTDGWIIIYVERRWDGDQLFKKFITIKLSALQIGEIHALTSEFLDWVNCDPEYFAENETIQEKKAA